MKYIVWTMPRTRTVLLTDDPGVPVNACYIQGKESPELGGTYHQFETIQEADTFAEAEAKRLNYHLVQSWIWAPWADDGDDDYEYDY